MSGRENKECDAGHSASLVCIVCWGRPCFHSWGHATPSPPHTHSQHHHTPCSVICANPLAHAREPTFSNISLVLVRPHTDAPFSLPLPAPLPAVAIRQLPSASTSSTTPSSWTLCTLATGPLSAWPCCRPRCCHASLMSRRSYSRPASLTSWLCSTVSGMQCFIKDNTFHSSYHIFQLDSNGNAKLSMAILDFSAAYLCALCARVGGVWVVHLPSVWWDAALVAR